MLRLIGPLFRPFVVRSRMPSGFRLPSAAEATAYPPVESPAAGLGHAPLGDRALANRADDLRGIRSWAG